MQLITQDNIAAELTQRGIQFSTLGLQLPEDTTEEQWAEIGKKLCRCNHVMNWWIADWAAFGDKQWGALKKFAELNGWAEKTIYNAATVARSVDTSHRREDLSFSHHEAVACLPAKKQRELLSRAHDEGLAVGPLRAVVRSCSGKEDANKADGVVMHWPQDKSVGNLVPWLKARPAEYWTPHAREWWKTYLKPLVEFYEKL